MEIKLGCAPINWSNDDLPSLGGDLTYQQCLSEMALAGFTGSEGGWKYPKEFEVIKKAIDLRNITICNMWFSTEFTTFKNEDTYKRFDEHMEYTYALGARVVGAGECGVTIHGDESIPLRSKRPILDDKQFENLANGLNELGRRAHKKGMKLCFHAHVGTGVETEEEINRLMSMTEEGLVYLLFDTGHLTLAGADPVDILQRYMNRIGHIHVKDVRSAIFSKLNEEDWSFLHAVKEGIFTVPGDGDMVDWDGVFGTIKQSEYEGWIVVEAEQDPKRADPLEYAIKARKFIRQKLGV